MLPASKGAEPTSCSRAALQISEQRLRLRLREYPRMDVGLLWPKNSKISRRRVW